MGMAEMRELLNEYRISCNLLTERIDEINKQLRVRVTEEEYKELSGRRRTLREERLDILNAMHCMQEYCR